MTKDEMLEAAHDLSNAVTGVIRSFWMTTGHQVTAASDKSRTIEALDNLAHLASSLSQDLGRGN